MLQLDFDRLYDNFAGRSSATPPNGSGDPPTATWRGSEETLRPLTGLTSPADQGRAKISNRRCPYLRLVTRQRVFERRDGKGNDEHSEAEEHSTHPAA